MTEKRTFREAVEEAHKVAGRVFLTALASGEKQGDAERKSDIEFLKSIEAQGATILWGERTESMVNAAIATFGKDDDRTSTEMTIDCCDAYVKAAPTVTDLLRDER